MESLYERAEEVAKRIRELCDREVKLCVVLGSGLGAFVDVLENKLVIPYEKIEGFPRSGVKGHAGNLVFGQVDGQDLVVMQGRVHFYESGDFDRTTFPMRVMRLLGCEKVMVTNAAGAVNKGFDAGDLMIITDQLNMMMSASPLIGPNDDRFGPRFPDMSEPYNHKLTDCIRKASKTTGVKVREGVYCAFSGPEYETPVQVRMAALIGADAVGMSTVPEVIVANHMGMQCCGVSCMTNKAAGISEVKLSHAEVMEVGKRVSADFIKLIAESVRLILKA